MSITIQRRTLPETDELDKITISKRILPTAPEIISPVFSGQPKTSLLQEAIIKPVKTFFGGVDTAVSKTADLIDFYAGKNQERLGIPELKTGIFKGIKSLYETEGEKLSKEGVSNKFTKALYSGLGQAAWDLPVKYMGPGKFLKGVTLPAVGAVEGLKEGGVKGAVIGGVSGGLMTGVLKGLNVLPTPIKLPTAFGIGATVTPGGPEEKVAGGAVFTGLSLGGRAPTMEQFKGMLAKSPITTIPKRILPAEKMEGLYQNFVNRMQSIENVVQKAKDLGAKILPGENPALRARTYLGIGQKVKTVLEKNTYKITPEGKIQITGEGLKPILDNYDKISPEKNRTIRDKDLTDYLIATRTIKDLQRPKSEFTQENIVTPEQVKTAQGTLDRLGKKYGVSTPTGEGKVGQKIPTELEAKNQAISKLISQASKEKSAEDFFKAIDESDSNLIQEYGYKSIKDFYNQAKLSPIGEGRVGLVDIAKQNIDVKGNFTMAGDTLTKELSTRTNQEIIDLMKWSREQSPHTQRNIEQTASAELRSRGIAVDEIKWQVKQLSTPTEGKAATTIPLLDQTATRLYDYQKRVLSTLVDSGNISQEQYNTILAKNPNYVPFDRVIESVDTAGTPVSKNRFTGARSPIKRIRGSELEIHNPIESMIKNTYRIMDIAERNTVARGVANLSKVLPEDISPVKITMQPVNITEQETGGEAKTIFRPSQFKPKGNVIEYFENGNRKYMEVTPNLYQAMTGLNEISTSLLTKIMSIPAGTLRTGATITPEFMLRNPIRDQWTAFIQTKLGFKPFVDASGAIADIMGKSEAYNDWLRSGGAYSGFTEVSRPNLQRILKDLQGKPNLLKNLNIITKAQDISQLFEQATRLGIYKAGIKKGLTPVEAGFQSREATVDFARRGAKTKNWNSIVAFWNAGIQGTDKLVRTAKEDPAGFAAKSIATITIPSLITYILNRNDPEYKELPRWQKDLFWIFKIKDTWIRIPKPFAYGQFFGSLPERFMEYLDTQDPKAFNSLTKTLYDSLSPGSGDPAGGLMATGVKPLVENATNWSFFAKRPIVPEGKKNLLPEKQFGRYTTETAKYIGKIINYSPAKIENLVRGWFGGSGTYALQALDKVGEAVKRFTGQSVTPSKPTELSDIPLIKGFVARSPEEGTSESINQFYQSKNKITQAYLTIKKYQQEGNQQKVAELQLKYPNYKLYPAVNRVSQMLSDLSNYEDKIVKSNKPDKEKRELLKKINQHKMIMTQQANKFIK